MAERRFGAAHDHMAVTVFSTIHFSRRINPQPGNSDMGWLIHELTHAAQMEHVGSQFMGEAVYDQGAAGYDYGGPKALAGRKLRTLTGSSKEILPSIIISVFLINLRFPKRNSRITKGWRTSCGRGNTKVNRG